MADAEMGAYSGRCSQDRAAFITSSDCLVTAQTCSGSIFVYFVNIFFLTVYISNLALPSPRRRALVVPC
ncbi:hypothetical protein C0Q70_04241 [Pomacea canaliculata]|uniref:Uncharacterized protein n=1 Tax=Pomacea canaliculata TaxID=400727 RepID=A0A2T7PUZ3_POMCA|nr:hypothetical protein C0Q70_04241 [Pomacea canaliculata]